MPPQGTAAQPLPPSLGSISRSHTPSSFGPENLKGLASLARGHWPSRGQPSLAPRVQLLGKVHLPSCSQDDLIVEIPCSRVRALPPQRGGAPGFCVARDGVWGPGRSGRARGGGTGSSPSACVALSFLNVLHHLDHVRPGPSREGCSLPEPLSALFLHRPLQGISCFRLSSQLNLPFSLGAKSHFVIFHLHRQPPVRHQRCSSALPGKSDTSSEGPNADFILVPFAPSCRASVRMLHESRTTPGPHPFGETAPCHVSLLCVFCSVRWVRLFSIPVRTCSIRSIDCIRNDGNCSRKTCSGRSPQAPASVGRAGGAAPAPLTCLNLPWPGVQGLGDVG